MTWSPSLKLKKIVYNICWSCSSIWENSDCAWIQTNSLLVFVPGSFWVSSSTRKVYKWIQIKSKIFEMCLHLEQKSKSEDLSNVWITFPGSFLTWLPLVRQSSSCFIKIRVLYGMNIVRKRLIVSKVTCLSLLFWSCQCQGSLWSCI